jgi:hypothetical protein
MKRSANGSAVGRWIGRSIDRSIVGESVGLLAMHRPCATASGGGSGSTHLSGKWWMALFVAVKVLPVGLVIVNLVKPFLSASFIRKDPLLDDPRKVLRHGLASEPTL